MDWTVYVDGACRRNPDGPGGWAFVALYPNREPVERSGSAPKASNNQMELTAVLEALAFLPRDSVVAIWSDSRYVVDGFSSWTAGWVRRGWRTKDGSPVRNRELWEAGLAAIAWHRVVHFRWLRGHSGDRWNERADLLANLAADRAQRSAYVDGWTRQGAPLP